MRSLRHQNNQDLNRMRLDDVWLPVKPNHLQSLIVLIADLKMTLSPNGDMKNETNRIQLLTLTWIYVKTAWWTMEWNMNDKSHSIGDDKVATG